MVSPFSRRDAQLMALEQHQRSLSDPDDCTKASIRGLAASSQSAKLRFRICPKSDKRKEAHHAPPLFLSVSA